MMYKQELRELGLFSVKKTLQDLTVLLKEGFWRSHRLFLEV